MTADKYRINYWPLVLIALSDSIIFYKYGGRMSTYILPITLVFFFFKLSLPLFAGYITALFKEKTVFICIATAYFLLSVAVLYTVSPQHVRVDRWDAVVAWWDAFFDGKFPYSARTRWGGFLSPLPFFQVLYLPFYFIGEIGWMNIMAASVLLVYLKCKKFTLKEILLVLLLMLTSPALWWEQCVRSTLFVNGLLALVMMEVIVSVKKAQSKDAIFQGVVAGLFISSRLALLVPLVSAISFSYLKNFRTKQSIWLAISIIAAFSLTLAPLVYFWGIDDFLRYNVFTHHNNHMPLFFTILFLVMAIASGLSGRYGSSVLLLNGVILWLMGLVFIAHAVYEHGFEKAYTGSYGDVSYFILSYATLLYCTLKTHSSDN